MRQKLITYLQQTYGTVPERPWRVYPDYCTFKTRENQKWYAILMDVPAEKLWLPGNARVDLVNLKLPPALIAGLIDQKRYLMAYHMNKEHWVSVVLDENTDWSRLKDLIATSYRLVAKVK